LCLLIYHAADYHNPRVVTEGWKNLISSTHEDVESQREAWEAHQAGQEVPADAVIPTGPPPQPYEVVSSQIQSIAHRTSLDSLIFPIDSLLVTLCEYAITQGQGPEIGADPSWPILLFLQLGTSYVMITRILERIFDTHEAPFTGRRLKFVVEWIDTTVEAWLRDAERRGPGLGGKGDANPAPWVTDLLDRASQSMAEMSSGVRDPRSKAELDRMTMRTRDLKNAVGSYVRQSNLQGSLRFSRG